MRNLLFWLLSCFLVTLFCGLVYATGQQILRQSANDPQVQIAGDLTYKIQNGQDPKSINLGEKVDMAYSASPFVIIYDENLNEINTNAIAWGKKLNYNKPPKGVFEYAKQHMWDSITWQPTTSWRYATEIYKAEAKDKSFYFVLVARSLGLTEQREDQLLLISGMAWFLGISATSGVFFLASKRKR